ncbi:MAG: hypothetical protein ACI9CA_001374 [Natronomonas sp.]|jgi:hypothetical protein
MADLLTHVLAAYVLLTVVGWWVAWLGPRWVAVGMGGAAIPDLVKVERLVNESVIQSAFGVPFAYDPVSSLAGVLVIAGIITLFFGHARRRVYGLLVTGGGLSLVLDGLRVFVDGSAGFWLYPLWWRPPAPSLYVTADARVLVVAAVVSGGVFVVNRYAAAA